MLRWLLPIIAVMTLLGSSVTAWAAAGFVGEASCCCPDKTKCKCHDHDGDRDASPTLKRCAGEATWVAPAVAPAVAASEPPVATDVQMAPVATIEIQPLFDLVTPEIVTPPF